MRIRPGCCVPLAVLLLGWGAPAGAHLMPEKNGTVNVVAHNAYIVLSVPTSVLTGYDDNRDRQIDVHELSLHSDALRAEVLARFNVADAKLVPTGSVTWLLTPNTGDAAQLPSDYLLVAQSLAFPAPPANLRIRYDLFGAAAAERQLTLTATHGADREVLVLTPAQPHSRIFRDGWQAFADFLRLGATHILGGLDHLAFLLTIIAAGTGLRYWFSVITSFTIAHSITLALAASGVVSLPASIVEPVILLSIVVMGADAMMHRKRALWTRAALVFACGLIHGLGFAAAIGDIGIDARHQLPSLPGFNSGIEIGQALFVSVVLGLVLIVRHLRRPQKA